MFRAFGLLAVVLLSPTTATAQIRTWTDVSGKYKVEASVTGYSDGKAELTRDDGKVIKIPLERLCEQDRKYVQSKLDARRELRTYRIWQGANGKKRTLRYHQTINGFIGAFEPNGDYRAFTLRDLSPEMQRWFLEALKRAEFDLHPNEWRILEARRARDQKIDAAIVGGLAAAYYALGAYADLVETGRLPPLPRPPRTSGKHESKPVAPPKQGPPAKTENTKQVARAVAGRAQDGTYPLTLKLKWPKGGTFGNRSFSYRIPGQGGFKQGRTNHNGELEIRVPGGDPSLIEIMSSHDSVLGSKIYKLALPPKWMPLMGEARYDGAAVLQFPEK